MNDQTNPRPAKTAVELLENPAYKACKACGEAVHHKNKGCKACGAPSPWKAEAEAPPEPKWSAARTTREYIGILTELGIDTTDLVKVADEIEAIAALEPNATAPVTMADVKFAQKIAQENDHGSLAFAGPADTEAQVFMAKFTTQIGSVMCHFVKGQVVEDHVLIGQLIELNAPMVPVVTSKGMVCCPQCKTIFPAKPEAAPKRRAG